jgi:hypothetical protein
MEFIKNIKRKFGVFAPQVTVRPHVPWYLRWLVYVVLIALLVLLSWIMFDAGRQFTSFDKKGINHELDQLSDFSARLKRDNEKLRSQVTGLERQLQMDRTTREDISRQIKTLVDENTNLKEDLVFFQNLISGDGKAAENIFIYHFKLERGQSPEEYRYILVLLHGGQHTNEFKGKLAFAVHLWQDGKKVVMPLPSESSSGAFSINFKFYHRIERTFKAPSNAVVKGLQVKVFEKGTKEAKSTRLVNLSL